MHAGCGGKRGFTCVCHIVPEEKGSPSHPTGGWEWSSGKEVWGFKSLPDFVKYVWMGMSGGGDGPEISPNTPKDSMAQTDGC